MCLPCGNVIKRVLNEFTVYRGLLLHAARLGWNMHEYVPTLNTAPVHRNVARSASTHSDLHVSECGENFCTSMSIKVKKKVKRRSVYITSSELPYTKYVLLQMNEAVPHQCPRKILQSGASLFMGIFPQR